MVFKYCALALLALCVFAIEAQAQECLAGSVVNATVDAYHTLSWAVSEDEVCEITQFLVDIYKHNGPIQYSFEVDDPWVDVSFLRVCEDWIFIITPVSQHTKGREYHFSSRIPLPAGSDLSLAYINITTNGTTGDSHLRWTLMDSRYDTCSLQYRLTIEKYGEVQIHDIYLNETSITLDFLSPCTTYQFGVRAINIAHPTVEGPLRTQIDRIPAAAQTAPRLNKVDLNSTGFNITWELQSIEFNSCEVTELYIDGKDVFDRMINITDDFVRRPIEVEIDNLLPNTMYYLRAFVLNTAGWSAPTVVAVQTLDIGPDKAAKKSVQ